MERDFALKVLKDDTVCIVKQKCMDWKMKICNETNLNVWKHYLSLVYGIK